MKSGSRRRYTSEQKANVVKRHLIGKEDVSTLCSDLDIAPNQFYRWQKELFDHAPAAFEVKKRGSGRKCGANSLELKVLALEERLRHKDSVIAEVVEECVKLKKKPFQN